MKITIALRTYKRPEYFKQALASVHYQTHTDWELFIFDDSGDNQNVEIFKTFKNQHPNHTVLYVSSNTPRYLFKESWIMQFKLATGEVCVRLDDDDLLTEDSLSYISKIYTEHSDLDFSYGSSIYFDETGLTETVETKTPHEHEKTRHIWEGYLNEHPYDRPWRFKYDHYNEPQFYTSIIHCSKANKFCTYGLYAMRTKAVMDVVDEIKITTKVDDLEFMGSLEYLGLSHTSIKKSLLYVRNHEGERLTGDIENDILDARDKTDWLRPKSFQTNIYTQNINGNISLESINKPHKIEFAKYYSKVKNYTKLF